MLASVVDDTGVNVVNMGDGVRSHCIGDVPQGIYIFVLFDCRLRLRRWRLLFVVVI
jgi:hypothetical protein